VAVPHVDVRTAVAAVVVMAVAVPALQLWQIAYD